MPSLKANGKRLNGKGGGWIAPTRRLAIYLRDGFLCSYCGADLHEVSPRHITLDHLTPQCRGGSHHTTNLVTSCLSCNSRRQNKPWRTFCAPGAVDRIVRNRRKSIVRLMRSARSIIEGRCKKVEEGTPCGTQ